VVVLQRNTVFEIVIEHEWENVDRRDGAVQYRVTVGRKIIGDKNIGPFEDLGRTCFGSDTCAPASGLMVIIL
jgi:hypothetical protein